MGAPPRRWLHRVRCAAACFVSIILLATAPAGAQERTKLGRVEMVLWPEYDRPAVLVIYRVRLPPDAKLPASVPLRIPADVGAPHAVASRAGESLVVAPYTTSTEGDWTTVTIYTSQSSVQLEYYANFALEKDTRRFAVQWLSGVEVDELAYEVQVPPGSSNFRITPPSTTEQLGLDGVLYARAELGAQPAGEPRKIAVSYEKTGPQMTSDWTREHREQLPSGATDGSSGAPMPVPALRAGSTPGSEHTYRWPVVLLVAATAFAVGLWVGSSRRRGSATNRSPAEER